MAGKGTPATAILVRERVSHTLHSYAHDPRQSVAGYGREAAEALGVAPERVFKTLLTEVDGALAVGIVPVSTSLNLKALAAALRGKRARMADVAVAQRATGYVAGGMSPLGQRTRLPTVLDSSATRYDTVFCSAGRRGLEIELAAADLLRLTDGTLAAIAA